jgi:hypothetical protein
MIPLGVIILVRTQAIAVTLPGVLIGGAFVAFGVYRLWTAWSRYRLYRQRIITRPSPTPTPPSPKIGRGRGLGEGEGRPRQDKR